MRQAIWPVTVALIALMLVPSDPGFGREQRKPRRAPAPAPREPAAADAGTPALTMTKPVACAAISGYEKYEVLPDAALTSDEKLQVYYRPLNYLVKRDGSTYRIHLIQDGQIRRRGEEAALLAKPKVLDYEWKGKEPPKLQVYLRNTIGLKGLQPGDYEYDITLHDALAPGEPVARQVLAFRVVPPGPRSDEGEVGKGRPEGPSTSP